MKNNSILQTNDRRNLFQYLEKLSGILVILAVPLLLGGCAAFQNDTSYNIEKQIERQQMQHELKSETVPEENRTAAEYEEMGDRYLLRGDINRAYIYYIKGLGVEPDNVSMRHKQGTLLLKKSKFVEAEAVYTELLESNSEDSVALEGRGKASFGQGKLAEAEHDFLAALEIKSDQYQSYEFLGLICSGRQEYNLAINRFKTALIYQPLNERIRNNLAVTYYLNGDFKEAVRLFQVLAKTSSNSKIYNNLALAYFQLGFYEEAMDAFKRGSENEAAAYNNMGYQFLTSKKYRDAIQAFEKAIDLYPKFYPYAQKNLGIAKQGLSNALAGAEN